MAQHARNMQRFYDKMLREVNELLECCHSEDYEVLKFKQGFYANHLRAWQLFESNMENKDCPIQVDSDSESSTSSDDRTTSASAPCQDESSSSAWATAMMHGQSAMNSKEDIAPPRADSEAVEDCLPGHEVYPLCPSEPSNMPIPDVLTQCVRKRTRATAWSQMNARFHSDCNSSEPESCWNNKWYNSVQRRKLWL